MGITDIIHKGRIIERGKNVFKNNRGKDKEGVSGLSKDDDSRGTANRVGSPCFTDVRYAEIFLIKPYYWKHYSQILRRYL